MTPLGKIIERLDSGIELNENITNNKLRSGIDKNRASHILNVLKSFKEQAESYLEEEKLTIKKADSWDALDKEIGELYDEDDEDGMGLITIGETSASAFGYL